MVPMSCLSHFRNFSITSERNLSSFCSSINKKNTTIPPYHFIEHLFHAPVTTSNLERKGEGME